MSSYSKDGKELGFELLASELLESVVKAINGLIEEYKIFSPQKKCLGYIYNFM